MYLKAQIPGDYPNEAMAEGGLPPRHQPETSSESPQLSPIESEAPPPPTLSPVESPQHSRDSLSYPPATGDPAEDAGNTELHCACADLDAIYVAELLKSGASVDRTNRRERSCLHELLLSYLSLSLVEQASRYKTLTDVISLLVTAGLDVNMGDFKFQTPLHYAVRHPDQAGVIRALAAAGTQVNLPDHVGQTCLHLAVVLGDLRNVGALMEAGAEPNVMDHAGTTALHLAAKGRHHEEVIEMLIRCGADPDVTNCAMKTPLHVAAKAGRHDIMSILLVAGADVMSRDNSGITPLHLAAGNDMTGRACTTLLRWWYANRHSMHFDIDATDKIYKETPLHRAVRMSMTHNIRSLVAFGARVDVQDASGNSALHRAAALREVGAWKNLIGRGQRHAQMQNAQGLTPFQLAAKANNRVAMNMIREYCRLDY